MANNLNILWISENYVKQQSSVMDSVENKFIRSHILEAQNIHIQNILGSQLYDGMITQFEDYKNAVDAGTTGVTVATYVDAKYLTLVDDYIQPCLLYYTLYESMYDLMMKYTNKGVVVQTSDYSDTVDLDLFRNRRKDFQNKAEYYAERLTKYLLDNTTTYTLFLDGTSSDSNSIIEPETDTNYFNGMYLKDTCNKCLFDKNKIVINGGSL